MRAYLAPGAAAAERGLDAGQLCFWAARLALEIKLSHAAHPPTRRISLNRKGTGAAGRPLLWRA